MSMNTTAHTTASTIGFVFSRGWAMPEDFFAPLQTQLRQHFPHASMQTLEMFDASQAEAWFGIGHSFGLVQLLRAPTHWRGLVSLCGFTHFCATEQAPGVTSEALQTLRNQVGAGSATALRHFYRQCNLPLRPAGIPLHTLLEGLDDLGTCRASLRGPVLPLAAANDAIVPPELTRACFSTEKIVWHPTAGHALGWQEAAWCAENIHAWTQHLQVHEVAA